MQINISGHHIEVTDSLKTAIHSKLKKLSTHYPDIESAHIYLNVEKHEQTAEAIVHYFGQDLVAKAKSEDLYQSIGDLSHKLESLLQRRKQTVKGHGHSRPSHEQQSDEENPEESAAI